MNFEGEKYTAEETKAQLLPERPNHPFFMWYKPTMNLFVYLDVKVGKPDEKGVQKTKKKGFFVPALRLERIKSGVNGMKQLKGEIADPAPRMIALKKKGCVILDPAEHDYLRRYRTSRGGYYHNLKFQTVRFKAGKVIKEMDELAKYKWSIDLMVEGALPEFEPAFLEAQIAKKKRIPERYVKQQHIPEIGAKLKALQKEVKDMESFVAEFKKKGLKIFEGIA